MTFQFTPAVRENVSLLIALAGPSGSGKTKSALRLAEGLADGGPIAFIDTEARRGLHYADQHKFIHADMRPPFRPARFIEAVRVAEDAGAKVVIIDSFSLEYEGEGGILDWAAELEEAGTKPPGNWKVPKQAHKRLMNDLLQCRASIIFCLRADEKIEIVRESGRTQVRPLGWMPICEKRFMYEMTASFTLTADNPGKPNYRLPHKCQEQHRGTFPEGQFIDERAGRALAAWAKGGTAPTSQRDRVTTSQPAADDAPQPMTKEQILAQATAAKAMGTDALRTFWGGLTPAEKKLAGGSEALTMWKADAELADRKMQHEGAEQ